MRDNSSFIYKIFILTTVLLFIGGVLFQYLCGEQLYKRDSKGTIDMPNASAGTIELSEGHSISQEFSSRIEQLNNIGIKFGTFQRCNSGDVNIKIINITSKSTIAEKRIDAGAIREGEEIDIPIDGVNICGDTIRIYIEADSEIGYGVSPLMSDAVNSQGLYFDGNLVNGVLCFSAEGTDKVWLGEHYWLIMFLCIVVVLCVFLIEIVLYKKNKKTVLIHILLEIKKYNFLIKQLVKRDFKIKYKRSILGVLWSILNPLLMMSVQYFIFSTIFKTNVPFYGVYLLIGIVFFNFFSESCGMSMMSIVGNAGLINKVYVPKYIYPLTKTTTSLVNLGFSLIPLLIVSLVSGIEYSKAVFLIIIPIVCLIIFNYGMGMILATLMVFFRDTQFLWSIISVMWMYATPLFYTEDILPETYRVVLKVNPLYYYISAIRRCIIDGVAPEPKIFAICILSSAAMVILGGVIFKRNQDKFILYI